MKALFVLRGLPGSGKSTFIKENRLEPFTISPDNIRMLLGGLELTLDGSRYTIPQKNDNEVWKIVDSLLQKRLDKGILTILDATSLPLKTLNKYKKLCEEYRCRLYIVDFTDVSYEECIERNYKRELYKFVPIEVMERMNNTLNSVKLPTSFEVITPDEASQIILNTEPEFVDLNKYEKVFIFGDIHGCYTALMETMDCIGDSGENYYIFTGDLLDRGIENKKVMEFVLEKVSLPNYKFVRGNHDSHIEEYVKTKKIATEEFGKTIESLGDIKDRLKEFTRRLNQLFLFTFNGKKFVVTHGGVSNIPTIITPTYQLTKGVGNYTDSETVDKAFCENTESNMYSIHGHRNVLGCSSIQNTERTFNLEGKVELGGSLRVLEINKSDDGFKCIYMPNYVYSQEVAEKQLKMMEQRYNEKNKIQKMGLETLTIHNNTYENNNDILQSLDLSSLIRKKELDNDIVSYNFTRDAFYKKEWDNMTTTARGLFVDSLTGKIVARSYKKFFNIGERNETCLRNLEKNLKYPVVSYIKENGFLGIVSYNPKTDDLFIASKSTDTGDFKNYFQNILLKSLKNKKDDFKKYLKDNNCSAIFECIDIENDPHIIQYFESKVVLLDVVKNTFDEHFLPYDELVKLSIEYGLEFKKVFRVINDSMELNQLLKEVKDNKEYEGLVLVDSDGFMVKSKFDFYKFWKDCRKLKDSILKNKEVKQVGEEFKNIFEFMKQMNLTELSGCSIIDVRNKFIENKGC